jgi:hypothetical protein
VCRKVRRRQERGARTLVDQRGTEDGGEDEKIAVRDSAIEAGGIQVGTRRPGMTKAQKSRYETVTILKKVNGQHTNTQISEETLLIHNDDRDRRQNPLYRMI